MIKTMLKLVLLILAAYGIFWVCIMLAGLFALAIRSIPVLFGICMFFILLITLVNSLGIRVENEW